MRAFRALLRRELGSLFWSPLAWSALTFFLVVMGMSFWMVLDWMSRGAERTEGGNIVGQWVGSIFFWLALLVLVPLITMRTIAEERRTGTFEMLITAPVRDATVVLAKYLAVWLLYVVLWGATLLYALVLHRLEPRGVPLDVPALAVAYLGVLCIGSAALAVGLFTSACARHPVSAGLACFGILCTFFLVGFLPYLPHGESLPISLHYVSGVTHLLDFSRGVLDSRAMAFYVINTAWLLWLTVKVLEARRWS